MLDKMKDLMRKATASSPASSFKGPSHVLGSGPPPSASASSSRSSNPNPRPAPKQQPPRQAGPSDFAPFSPLISTSTSSSSSSRRPDAAAAACPNCAEAFPSELAVSGHLDGCLASASGARARAVAYLAGDPPAAAVEVVKRLLGNLLNEPGNDKYRRVRLGNPRIKEAVADRDGGLELLEAVGFRVVDEGGELFAVMDEAPEDARLGGIRHAVLLLERAWPSAPPQAEAKESCPNGVKEKQEVKKIVDRQIRVFFNVPGSSIAQNDLPDSFQIRNEAKMRRERLE